MTSKADLRERGGADDAASRARGAPMRLQRWLAQCGFGSRRACEEIIARGRVTLNGQSVTRLGTTVDPARDAVTVDGKPVARASRRELDLQVWAFHKPRGVTATLADPHAARTLRGFLPRGPGPGARRLFPVGRLDRESEGLMLFTNDGDLAQRLTHPSLPVEKEYEVWLEGRIDPGVLRQWRHGVAIPALEEERAPGGSIVVHARGQLAADALDPSGVRRPLVVMVLTEGRKRQIRRMIRAAGAEVRALRRVRIGPIHLGDLPPGASRQIEGEELEELRKS